MDIYVVTPSVLWPQKLFSRLNRNVVARIMGKFLITSHTAGKLVKNRPYSARPRQYISVPLLTVAPTRLCEISRVP